MADFHLKKGEKLLYGFKTLSGKVLGIAIGRNDSYLVYRYGKPGRVEFEYPKEHNKNSFSLFEYSSYFRGGGAQNEGLDLQYLKFRNGNFVYTVFDEYSAEGNNRDIGIKVSRKGEKKALAIIHGKLSTVKGSLGDIEDLPVKHVHE